LRLLLSMEREPPILRIARSGVVPKIINFMYSDKQSNKNNKNKHNQQSKNKNRNANQEADIKKKIQFEAAWMITNICAGATQYVTAMVQQGAIKAFVDLLRNADSSEMADQAVWGLGNIIGEGRKFKDQILSSGVINDFVAIIDDYANVKDAILGNCLWALSNFFRCNMNFELNQISSLINGICRLLKETKDEKQISEALRCFNFMSLQSDKICNYLAKAGAVNIAMKFLHQETAKYEVALQAGADQTKLHRNDDDDDNKKTAENAKVTQARIANSAKMAQLKMNSAVYRPALRMIGNLLSGDDFVTQTVLEAGYMEVIYPFLTHFTACTRKEMMWSLSNIMAGSHQQIEMLLSREKLFEAIINSARSDVHVVQKEACFCICNALVDCVAAQKKKMVEYGCIEALVGILKNPELSQNATTLVLEGLEAFLAT